MFYVMATNPPDFMSWTARHAVACVTHQQLALALAFSILFLLYSCASQLKTTSSPVSLQAHTVHGPTVLVRPDNT